MRVTVAVSPTFAPSTEIAIEAGFLDTVKFAVVWFAAYEASPA